MAKTLLQMEKSMGENSIRIINCGSKLGLPSFNIDSYRFHNIDTLLYKECTPGMWVQEFGT